MQDLIGQILAGRYRVEAAIGRGGMAEVYKVWDTHRAVHLAMKVLREDIAQDRVFIRRFKREAQMLAALQHPNIVRLYGLDQDHLLVFMLMDFIEGTNLRAEIVRARGPIAGERVLEVMRPVCSALHYAHNQGVIHCDIKPGNIMIDRRGTVLVADFGIARAAEGATVTMVGLGTPAYMAPELVLGQAPSSQTDIYALGVTLYEMLTEGERPFTGEAAKTGGTTAEKVRWEQVNLKPPSPRRFNRDLPRGVEEVVLRCLAKEPGHRYAVPLDLLNALERSMGGPEIAAPPPVVEARPAPRIEEPATHDTQPGRIGPRMTLNARPPHVASIPVWLWMAGVVVAISMILGVVALVAIKAAGVIPAVVEATATNTPKPGPTIMVGPQEICVYTIQKGDTLSRIALQFGLPTTTNTYREFRNIVLNEQNELVQYDLVLQDSIYPEHLLQMPVFSQEECVSYGGSWSSVSALEQMLATSPTSVPTATNTPMLVPMLTAGEQARALAAVGVTRNADWTPYTEEINGVLMALVPAGCFQMGNSDEDKEYYVQLCVQALGSTKGQCRRSNYDQEIEEVCLDVPFWLDVYEVTIMQFESFGGSASRRTSRSEDLPRALITWSEALSFCSRRGARLPSRQEFEYAARGPTNLRYPWGDDYMPGAVSGDWGWDPPGTRTLDRSWTGVFDLAGNVDEWLADTSIKEGSHETIPLSSVYSANIYYPGQTTISHGGSYLGFRCALSYQP